MELQEALRELEECNGMLGGIMWVMGKLDIDGLRDLARCGGVTISEEVKRETVERIVIAIYAHKK